MIARLRGEVIEKSPQALTLDVQGVGYSISVVDEYSYALNQPVDLHTYYHWNQEQGPQLFGFTTALQKTVFGSILSCSGCGPKIGLAVLAHMSAQAFLQAVSLADTKALNAVSGIGQKKAELMIMQLKDKVTKIAPSEGGLEENATLKKIKQVHEVLASLHYKQAEINSALEYLNKQMVVESAPFDELLRKGLSFLAKRL